MKCKSCKCTLILRKHKIIPYQNNGWGETRTSYFMSCTMCNNIKLSEIETELRKKGIAMEEHIPYVLQEVLK